MQVEWKFQDFSYRIQQYLSEEEKQGGTGEAFTTQRLSESPMYMKSATNICETDDSNF